MDGGRYAVARRYLVADLEKRGLLTDPAVRQAFLTVPRHAFVVPALEGQAYSDDALPIGEGQTISKPSTVAQMLDALAPAGERVLEIGTGSGYATALLACTAAEVYSIERHRPLSLRARRILQELGLRNVQCRTGDGAAGWPEVAPYTRILVTAEAPEVPATLLEQLEPGGIMVLPMRGRLCRILRTIEGHELEKLGTARFVPFVSPRFRGRSG